MEERLSKDEFDALRHIAGAPRAGRVSACVSRNAKRLSGLKLLAYDKKGVLNLTDKGRQRLHIQSCIDGLRAVASDPQTKLDADVALFLGKKGHIKPMEAGAGFEITDKGRESLADMDALDAGSTRTA